MPFRVRVHRGGMSTIRPVRELRTDGRPDGVLTRAWRRLLEGPHQWGVYDVTAGRSGVVHYRLTVFPPGTNAAERRALTRARDWPVVGAVCALVAIMGFGQVVGPALLTIGAIVVYALGIVWTRSRTRDIRRSVRTIDAVQVNDGIRNVSRGDLTLILASVAALRTLDENAPGFDAVDYEARWAEIYRSACAV
jgi:hypothetical protein